MVYQSRSMARRGRRFVLWMVGAGAVCVGGTAFGAISQSTITAPGGFVQAAAGPSTNGGPGWPGGDWTSAFPVTADRQEGSFTGNNSVSRSASFSGSGIVNSASGTAGMGTAEMNASNSFPSTAAFSAGVANGGWKESFVISHASFNGQAGTMQFTVQVEGRLDATGITGSAAITTTAYKDNAQLMSSPLASPGGSDVIGTDRQYGNWAVATFFDGEVTGKTVFDTVTFAVPFTFGTPFNLGVYVNARAGQRSSGGFGTPSTANVQLTRFRWGGIANIYAGANPIAGATVSSGTGINWANPIEPASCPGDLNTDGFVDDADFQIFAGAYNILDCADPSMPAGCPADLNGDGFVDDLDFSVFAIVYDTLLCP